MRHILTVLIAMGFSGVAIFACSPNSAATADGSSSVQPGNQLPNGGGGGGSQSGLGVVQSTLASSDGGGATAEAGGDGGSAGNGDGGGEASAEASVSISCPGGTAEKEPNDTLEQANTFPTATWPGDTSNTFTNTVCGVIDSATDVDIFTFTPTFPEPTNFGFSAEGNVLIDIILYGDEVAGPFPATQLNQVPVPYHINVPYFFRVHSADGTPQMYTITLTLGPNAY
jgi:hypothetical protein